jgi:hypothetical protein
MIVKLKAQNNDYTDLSPDQPYFVIGIESDDYRILNDHGKPYLYPSDLFTVADAAEASDWITEYGAEGERYSYPPELNNAGFFEDYFDGESKAISAFWHNVNQRLSHAA